MWGIGTACLLLVMIGAGCGSARGVLFPKPDKPLVWPEPPEKGRIRYIGQIRSEADLKREVSSMQALVSARSCRAA